MTRSNPFFAASVHPLENELLLVCTRVWQEVDVSRLSRILNKSGIDWDYVLETARRQRVLPLVAQTLRKHGADHIPESKMQRFDQLFRSYAARSLQLTATLTTLLAKFESEGVIAVSFKGPLLGQELYGDVTLRQFDDLDIVVSPQDVFRVKAFLEEQGFHTSFQIHRSLEKLVLETEYSLTCYNAAVGVSADLHWKLLGRYLGGRFDLTTVGETRWIELEGRPVRGLSKDATLIYLCAHGAKHVWPYLESVYAVARLVQLYPDIDWRRVHETAQRLGCLRMLHLGLKLADELFDIHPSPLKPCTFEDDPTTIQLAEKIIPSLFNKLDDGTGSDFSIFHFRVRDRLADTLRYALRLIFRPSRVDWRRFSRGGANFVAPYLLRPLRLVVNCRAAKIAAGMDHSRQGHRKLRDR